MEAYIGSRPQNGAANNRSLFIALVYTCQQPPIVIGRQMVTASNIGEDKYAITVSARVLGKLEIDFQSPIDKQACSDFFSSQKSETAQNVELVKVVSPYTDPQLVGNFLALVNTFLTNQLVACANYPTSMFGLNINCWVQSVLEYSGGSLSQKIKGIDITNQLRVPHQYFEQYIPQSLDVPVEENDDKSTIESQREDEHEDSSDK